MFAGQNRYLACVSREMGEWWYRLWVAVNEREALSTAPASDVTATSANALVGSALVGSPQKQLIY